MFRAVIKYITIVAAFLAFAWVISDWNASSVTWKDHARCLAAFLPSEHREGFAHTINHHIDRGMALARKDGIKLSRFSIRSEAMKINRSWVLEADSEVQFSETIKSERSRCSNI